MADNTRLNPGASGDLIATDDVGGVKFQRVKVNYGDDGAATDVSLASPLPVVGRLEEAINIRAGNVTGFSAIRKFGTNFAIGTTAEDVWDGGGTYDWQTAAGQLEVVSSSGNDVNTSGTGAWQLYIEGLDASYNVVSETINLNGASAVASSNTYLRIYRAYVSTAGSLATNAGNLTIRDIGGGTTRGLVIAGSGQTQMLIYTVPAGKTAYVFGSVFSSWDTSNQSAKVWHRLLYRPLGGVWRSQGRIYTVTDGSSTFQRNYNVPLVFGAQADIRIEARSSQSSTEVSAELDMVLVDN